MTLSLARYIRDIGPKGRKSSCKSDSLVSSDKFVTRIVAVSSVKKQVLITYKTRAHAQLSVTLLPQAVSQTFRHI